MYAYRLLMSYRFYYSIFYSYRIDISAGKIRTRVADHVTKILMASSEFGYTNFSN